MGLRFAENILYYLVVTFSITYLKVVVQTDTSRILLLLLVAHFVHFCAVPLVGKLSDAFGRGLSTSQEPSWAVRGGSSPSR